MSSIFYDHNTINYKEKKTVRNTNSWRFNNTFQNKQQVTEENKGEIKISLETNNSKPMGCSKSSSKREVYSNKSCLKKQEKH